MTSPGQRTMFIPSSLILTSFPMNKLPPLYRAFSESTAAHKGVVILLIRDQ